MSENKFKFLEKSCGIFPPALESSRKKFILKLKSIPQFYKPIKIPK